MTTPSMGLSGLPLFALLFENGDLRATQPLTELLGVERADEATLRRFDIARDGASLAAEELPWRRAAHGEPVDELELWSEAATGRRLWLRVRAVRWEGTAALAFADETEEQRAVELCGFSGLVARLLLQAGEARDAAAAILQKVSELFAAPLAVLLEPRSRGLGFAVSSAVGAGPDWQERLEAPMGVLGPVSTALGTRGPAEVADLASSPAGAWGGWLSAEGLHSLHVVPLVGFGEVVGLLVLARRSPGKLSPLELQTLSSAGEAWAVRLQHERGREAERRARRGVRQVTEAAFERGAQVPLGELLRLLVEQARTLTGARYGALGVLKKDRTGLEDFITVGMSEEEVGRLAHRPLGKGLLGAVVHEGRTIRVADIAADPRRYGFPANHPPMRTFLGGPLRLGKEVYGNFYLTEKEGGAEFTEDDERLLEAFAQQAALTIAYARETGEQRRMLDAVLRQTPHGVLFYFDERHIAFANAASERMLGVSAGHDLVAHGFALQAPDGAPIPRDQIPAIKALHGEPVTDREVRILRPGSPPLPAFVSAAPVWSETGTLLGAVVVLQDISAFKELERMREEFSSVVAHDLRNPVQAIGMQLQLLQRSAGGEGPVQVSPAALDRMQRASARLSLLISDLLEVSRIEGGRVALERKPISLVEAARALLRQMELTLGGRPTALKIVGEPPMVSADPLRLDQVLTNLVENANKYSAPGAPIELIVAASEGGASVTVKDQGAGIDPADLPRLFDRYYQAQRARVKGTGLGLGLFITKGLVDAHGGRLTVRSAPGQGSEFEVWLPAAAKS